MVFSFRKSFPHSVESKSLIDNNISCVALRNLEHISLVQYCDEFVRARIAFSHTHKNIPHPHPQLFFFAMETLGLGEVKGLAQVIQPPGDRAYIWVEFQLLCDMPCLEGFGATVGLLSLWWHHSAPEAAGPPVAFFPTVSRDTRNRWPESSCTYRPLNVETTACDLTDPLCSVSLQVCPGENKNRNRLVGWYYSC